MKKQKTTTRGGKKREKLNSLRHMSGTREGWGSEDALAANEKKGQQWNSRGDFEKYLLENYLNLLAGGRARERRRGENGRVGSSGVGEMDKKK